MLGWLIAAFFLWALLVLLEVYWNLYDWRPKFDSRALEMALGVCLILAAIFLLARARRQLAARAVSLVVCLALLALAIYVLPPEPPISGSYARQRSSPAWYRVVRFCALSSPTLFWVYGLLRRDAGCGQIGAAPKSGARVSVDDLGNTEAPPPAT